RRADADMSQLDTGSGRVTASIDLALAVSRYSSTLGAFVQGGSSRTQDERFKGNPFVVRQKAVRSSP
ncbi:MAG: hypothetical protein WBH61_03465, partial [Candidatus Methylomirabilis sp.]